MVCTYKKPTRQSYTQVKNDMSQKANIASRRNLRNC